MLSPSHKDVDVQLQKNGTVLELTVENTTAAPMTVEELSERTGVTVRNIRAYQGQGLIPAPERAGRVVLYDDTHVARLSRRLGLAQADELLRVCAWQVAWVLIV